MANIMDYLLWRGDLPVSAVPLCDIDYLILTQLVYGPIPNLDHAQLSGDTTLRALFPMIYPVAPNSNANESYINRYQLWQAAAASQRYGTMTLDSYSSIFDENQQFAAALFRTAKQSILAYRGTDGTLIGWREDFVLSFDDVIPAQRSAVSFLTAVAPMAESLVLCGHSKGGNLAMYAGVAAPREVRAKISRICSFDGPGLSDAMIASPNMAEMRDRIQSYIPEASIVGRMLSPVGNDMIIASDSMGIFQHNPFQWHLTGPCFETVRETTLPSAYTDRALHAYLKGATPEQRRMVVETGYNVLKATHASRVNEIAAGLVHHADEVAEAIRSVPEGDRDVVREGLRIFCSAFGDNLTSLITDFLTKHFKQG